MGRQRWPSKLVKSEDEYLRRKRAAERLLRCSDFNVRTKEHWGDWLLADLPNKCMSFVVFLRSHVHNSHPE